MAVTKIKPVKRALRQRLEYILNPSKTDGKMLVSSFGCSYETADIEFDFTLSKAMEKGNNQAHHLIQAFEPGESTPEQAHEIGRRLADEVTNGRYEYVIATHIDKGHIHNHIIFCAASFLDYKKYVSNKKSYYEIRSASDRLCKEYGLSVVTPGQEKGREYSEYAADRYGSGSWKSTLKSAVDDLIPQSKDFDDFLRRLDALGYEVKRGKYVSVRAPGQERFTRTKTLGADYTEDAIKKRIAGEYVPSLPDDKAVVFTFNEPGDSGMAYDILSADNPETVKTDSSVYVRPPIGVNLIVDLENCVKAQQSAGYARWQKIQNLKEAAKTLNFLTENNLFQYTDLEGKVAETAVAFDETADTLKSAEKRLADMAKLMKHIEDYQKLKPVYDGFESAKDKTAYKREHESGIILFEAAARALKKHAGDDMKLPNPDKLKTEYSRLTAKKNELRAEYGKLKRQARDYGVVKKNVDSILNPVAERARGRNKGVEL